MSEENKNGLNETVAEVSKATQTARSTYKAVKSASGLAKAGATGNPYLAGIVLAYENRGLIVGLVAMLMLPIIVLLSMPSLIFGGFDSNSNNDVMYNNEAIYQNVSELESIVTDWLNSQHNVVLAEVNGKIGSQGENSEYEIIDVYQSNAISNIYNIISRYCASEQNSIDNLNFKAFRESLNKQGGNVFYYTVYSESEIKTISKDIIDIDLDNKQVIEEEVEVTTYTYTININFEQINKLFTLDLEQEQIANEYENNLMMLMYGFNMNGLGVQNISEEVLKWEEVVLKYATQEGISEYTQVLMALMMQESGGRYVDLMQSSECSYNTKYPKEPQGITDSEYSIECGVKYFRDALNRAGCTSPTDINKLSLALQGYNFGLGYITWANNKYGGYSESNAIEFSNIQKANLGWSNYGDTKYVQHVLRYYIGTSIGDGTLIAPVAVSNWQSVVTSEFGMRIHPIYGTQKLHKGIDFGLSIGNPVISAQGGKVIMASDNGNGYGIHIIIDHQNGVQTLYAHLSRANVKVGDIVNQGVVIGQVGNTGNSTGPHLHFEVIVDGVHTNPRTFFK